MNIEIRGCMVNRLRDLIECMVRGSVFQRLGHEFIKALAIKNI